MNTRGLTELVVPTTGLRLGTLDQRTYSMTVVMALITTAMTGPPLALVGVRPPIPTGEAAAKVLVVVGEGPAGVQ
jgi:hypothetical protein